VHRLLFESHGVIAEASTDDEVLFGRLEEALPPGWRPATGRPQARICAHREGLVAVDGEVVARSNGDPEVTLITLSSTVRHYVAMLAPAHVFIHAGVVCVEDAAILIPGSSGSGKTTLVDALVHAGASYYSDEYAVVDAAGLIHPYAKPLSVRGPYPGPGWPVPVPESRVATTPIRAGLVVITSYEEGAEWQPEELSGGEGAIALLQHAIAARSRPGHVLAAVSLLARDARVISGPRGEAAAVARALLTGEFDSSGLAR